MRMPAPLLAVALAAVAAAPTLASGAAPELQRCLVGGVEARCGTVEVPERRDTEVDRRLELFVAVLPAAGDERQPDPVVLLEGGPGASVTRLAALHARTFASARKRRDLVLLDQRGTGRSGALDCDVTEGFRDLPTREGTAACAATLSTRADLAWYTTADAVDDLVEVLDHLGYDRVNLFAISNGTRTALRFLAAHPARVRTLTLLGPYPATRNVLLDGGEALDQALAGLVAECAGDATCAGDYPELARTVEGLPSRFAAEPEWSRFAAALRMMLFFPLQASRVPQLLDFTARSGRLPALLEAPTESGPTTNPLDGWISQGAFLSLLCSEDAARASVEQIRQRAEGTFLGSGWAGALADACEAWPRRPLPGDFSQPVAADVPALLLVGGLDPAVRPSWAREVAATLPRSRVVEIPEGQHSFVGMSGVECVLDLVDALLDRASVESLDVSCVDAVRRPPFAPPA